MGLQGVLKRIAIQPIVTFDTDLDGAISDRPRDAKHDIAVIDLSIIQRHLTPLIDLALSQLGGASDATAVPATIRQINALLSQAVQQRTTPINLECRTIAVRDGYGAGLRHSQISLVQSPPG